MFVISDSMSHSMGGRIRALVALETTVWTNGSAVASIRTAPVRTAYINHAIFSCLYLCMELCGYCDTPRCAHVVTRVTCLVCCKSMFIELPYALSLLGA